MSGNPLIDRINTRKRKRTIKSLLIAVGIICIIALITVFRIVSDYTGVDIKNSITIDIKQGSGGNTIVDQLKSSGAIKYKFLLKSKMKSGGYTQRLQPGALIIEPNMSYTEILEQLTNVNRDSNKVVIPEGYEIRQIIDTLENANLIDREEFISQLDPSKYNYKFLKDLPDRENPLEGYLFPDTYFISNSDTEFDIINMMLSEFDKQFKQEYYDRAKDLNMSVDEIVTLASIIERETDNDNERAKVAGVFYNRLKINMRLQSCATVQYILKERKTNLSIQDTKIKSPYNTYVNSGLPLGPIAAPGLECIKAALYPETTDALYFVMAKDGNHVFSKTYEDHLKAKNAAGL